MQQPASDQLQNPIDSAVAGWVATVTAYPRWAIALISLLVVVALAVIPRLSVDTDSSRMLSADLPFQQRANALNAAFPALKNVLIVVVRSDSDDAATAAVSAITAELARRDDAFEWVFAPSVDPYFLSHGLLFLDLGELDVRLTRLGKAANLLAGLRADPSVGGFLTAIDVAAELAARSGGDTTVLEPLYRETAEVLAAEGQGYEHPFRWLGALAGAAEEEALQVITLGPRLDFTALNPAKTPLRAVRDAIARLDPAVAGAVEIGITGDPALRAEEMASATGRLAVSFGLSMLLVALLLRLALGSFARAGLALAALVVTLVLTGGFAALAVGALNLISIAFVVLMVGLGIDFAIHFLAHFDEHAADAPGRKEALVRSGRAIGAALVLSAVTTAVAFLSFTTTEFTGMAQLGLIGAAGVLIALAATLTLIPGAIALWPRFAPGPRLRPLWQPPQAVRRVLRWVVQAVGVAGLAASPQARFDADPMTLRDPAAPSVEAYGWLAADPALMPLRLSLVVDSAERASALAAALKGLPEVRSAHWLGDLVPADQAEKLDLIDLAYPSLLHAVEGEPADLRGAATPVTLRSLARRLEALPGEAAHLLAAELRAYAARRNAERDAALAAALFRHFPPLIDRLRRQLGATEVTADALPAALRARYVSPDGKYRVEIAPSADLRESGALDSFVEAVRRVAPGAAGPPAQIAGAAGAVGGAMLKAAGLALLGCVVLAWAVLRDPVRIAAILVPLVLAGAATVGASVLLDIPFNYANVIVLPLLIGIGVASGVHFALRAGNPSASVFDTSTPRAVLYSALTTIAAFGTLGVSEHRGTASMGILLAISITAALVMVFALTPALIRLSRRRYR